MDRFNERGQMTNVLPPGIWDNPQPDEKKIYDQFVKVWSLDDSAYIQHYQEWSESQDFIDVAALAYDGVICPDCPTLVRSGSSIVLSIINADNATGSGGNSDDLGGPIGYNQRGCGRFIFGYSCPITFDTGVELPPEETILTAQAANYNCKVFNGWAIFENTLPEGITISEAKLRMQPGEDSLTASFADICASPGINIPLFGDSWDNSCDECPFAGYVNQYTDTCGLHPSVEAGGNPLDIPRVSAFDSAPAWVVGSVIHTRDISCVIQPQVNNQYITVAIGPWQATGIGINKRWYASTVELIVYTQDEIIVEGFGVKAGGQAEETMFGVADEFGSGGIRVSGIPDSESASVYRVYYFPEIGWGNKVALLARPITAQDVFYTTTGGVVVQRADVELHLDCNTPDAVIVEDVSSHERDATMVNMDADNFVDGRIASNKYLDFEIE